jgi:hypothetical protein
MSLVRPEQVVVVSGHMVDRPDRAAPRFPAAAETGVTAGVRKALERWQVGPGTLLVSGGARGADLIGAEQALDLGADVLLLLALPEAEFVRTSVALPGSDWEARYRAVRDRSVTRFQAEELGPGGPDGDVFARNNEWCLELARAKAPPHRLRALAVWDGKGGDGPGGTADFVDRAAQLGAELLVVDPEQGTIRDPAAGN